VLVIVMVLFSILGAFPFMLESDIVNQHQASINDLVAQSLEMQYQAALTVCAASLAQPACTQASSSADIDTRAALDPDIANAPLSTSGLIVARYDASGRIVAFVDEANQRSTVARQALWGQVSAILIKNSAGASGVGYWDQASQHVVGQRGQGTFTISARQGSHTLRDGNPIITTP